MSSPTTDLDGVLKVLPSPHSDVLEVVTAKYAALADEYGPGNVLVLKRQPAGVERVREALTSADATNATPRSPRVESLPEHASKVLEEYDPTLDRLAYEERIELVSMVIDGAKRDVPAYLERARQHDSFTRDVGQLLLAATRQGLRHDDLEEPHECLDFLYAMNDRFHEELRARGFVERADVIPRAVDLLEDDRDGLRSRVSSSFDAVLVLEFEECRRLDRRYLAALTDDAALVCLGERHASVERTRVEPGNLEDLADGLAIETIEPPAAPTTRANADHGTIVDLLATDESSGEPASVRRIRAGTAREQDRQVATEIQTLCDRHDEWRYDDVAVAVPTIERVPETRERLRDAGVPTATVGTHSLAQDPAVNELYAFVAYNCGHERERARERLAARVPDFAPDLVEECTDSSLARSLERWLVRTDLKRRIAESETWADAREQYESVRRVLEIARFVEETDVVSPDWAGLRRMLRRTIEYDAPYVHDIETRPETGGVTVCPVADLKYDGREAVFLLDLLDDRYPGRQHLTNLFPTPWLESMPNYPAVTGPSPADVARTFAPVSSPASVGNPFEAYHAQRARRALALGARAAHSQLYLCSYERESGGLGRSREESRYVKLLADHPDVTLEDVDARAREAAVYGRTSALEELLAEPRGELERVLREASTGGEADLAETEALFEEIAVVLEGNVDEELATAVRSQFEFAAGEVVRRD
ncbi:hypothetical protein ACFOZ7_18705 [Natribaculum luteum]|uniref:Superfamily I DNA or RNA helicase n=1 Tax=Natribaculum luteum TaxID=1586232 RepID=A0ABD5P3L5_9EURY|nr:hypothetical protein [Natribaculum luteum]